VGGIQGAHEPARVTNPYMMAFKGMYTKPAPLGGTHVALCIGNSKYASSPLNNTDKDAKDVAALCEKMGFATELVLDGSRRDMVRAVEVFARKLTKGGVSLLYFSGTYTYLGHGLGWQPPILTFVTSQATACRRTTPTT
jgi:Caspase domain